MSQQSERARLYGLRLRRKNARRDKQAREDGIRMASAHSRRKARDAKKIARVLPPVHVYTHAECANCGKRWSIDADDRVMPNFMQDEPDPLDGDWYTRLDPDGIVPIALCNAETGDPGGVCGGFVMVEPSRWAPRITVAQLVAAGILPKAAK